MVNDRAPRVWKLLVVYWLAQPIAVGLMVALWLWAMGDNDQMYFMSDPEDVFSTLKEPAYWGYMLFFSLIFTAAQACYLWPARKPGITTGKGRSIRLSVTVAGLMVGIGGLALTLGIFGLIDQEMDSLGTWLDGLSFAKSAMLVVVMVLALWALPTLVLLRFCKPGARETVLTRLANRVLLGTSAEVALLIPVDAMVRRRTVCYCAEGSFLGLTLLGMVGFVGAGPAVLLPLFAKRRRGWYRTHCNACGYDMSGDSNAGVCPECGRAWRSERGDRAGPFDQAPPAPDHPDQPGEPDEERQPDGRERDDPVGGGS